MPTNLPSDLLDLNERYWTAIAVNVRYWHKAAIPCAPVLIKTDI